MMYMTAVYCTDNSKIWETPSLKKTVAIAIPGECIHCYILKLENKNKKLKEGLNNIAAWSSGPTVNGSFDEPGSARIARKTLRECEEQ